jgi:hypothetical protein
MSSDPNQSPNPEPAATDALAARLATLEHRLDDLERTLSTLPLFQRQRQFASQTPPAVPVPAPSRPTIAASPAVPLPPPLTLNIAPNDSARSTAPVPAARSAHLPAATALQGPSFEKIVGIGFAVVGALMLVAGVAFALLWAYQQGLLRMPPVWRCMLAAGFGFSLVGVGEVLRRRLGPWPAAGSFAAGVGIVYASVFSAHRLYDLVAEGPAFMLLALTAAFGVAISAHARLSIVGVVSLIAGFMTPILIGGSSPSPWIMPMYLLALLAVGLALSGWLGGTFTLLRSVAWWGVILLGGAWATSAPRGHEPAATAFLLLVWGMVHFELWWSTSLRGLANQAPQKWMGEWPRWRPIAASISTTVWSVGLGVLVLREWGTVPDWLAPAAGLGGATALGLMLASHLRFMIDVPRTDRERLGAAMIAQAGALLIATIALATSGVGAIVCWLALALGAGGIARWLRAPLLLAYAAVALSILTGRLILWDSWNGSLHVNPVVFQGIAVTWWTGFTLVSALTWIWLAWLLNRSASPLTRAELDALETDDDSEPHAVQDATTTPISITILPKGLGTLTGIIGVLLAMASLLHPDASHASLALVWAAAGAAIAITGMQLPHLGLRSGGFFALGVSVLAWTVASLGPSWDNVNSPMLLHPTLWNALAIAGCIAAAAYQWNRSVHSKLVASAASSTVAVASPSALLLVLPICIIVASLLTLLATSMEASRVALLLTSNEKLQPVGVTLWWAAFAMGLLVAGFVRRWLWVRRVGLLLLAVAGFKAIIIDMAGVPLIGRVATFVAIGLLMLVVAAVYARLERSISPAPATPPTTPNPPETVPPLLPQ